MAVTSFQALEQAARRGDFEAMLGTPETSWVDFKAQGYLLSTTRGKFELGKDVAAFANSDGGCIIIGIKTEKTADSNIESAVELNPQPAHLLNKEQYRDVVARTVFPLPSGLDILVHPRGQQGSYAVIVIPSQAESARPFLVRYLIDDRGDQLHGFGWPIRHDDAVIWQPCEQFQNRLNLHAVIRQALDRIGEGAELRRITSDEAPNSAAHMQSLLTSGAERIRQMQAQLDTTAPAIAIQMVPRDSVDMTPVLYGETGIASDVKNWTGLRRNGFNLGGARYETDVRSARGIEYGARWRIAIDRDGLMSLIAPISDNALSWAMAQQGRPKGINAIALGELVHDFMRMFYEVLVPRGGDHSSWTGLVHVLGAHSGGVLLAPGHNNSLFDFVAQTASNDDFHSWFQLHGDANRDAFEALTRIYAAFGLGSNEVPFISNSEFSHQELVHSTSRR